MRLLLVALMAFMSAAAQAESFQRYHNDRFGVTADVPTGWRMGAAPENDDGRVFSSPDGFAEIIVSGGFAVLPISEEIALKLKPETGETIDYKSQGRDRLVVSGRKGDRIFYRKSLLGCSGTVWNSVSLDYPAAAKAAFDPIVARVAGSLRGGKGYATGACR
ncbi:hypothetical protein [Methylocystis echinoides]|uniref:hypothetical protein n=1 Tax=Methylocystis echinoides TaxID=29468 RepID=UPI00343EBDED